MKKVLLMFFLIIFQEVFSKEVLASCNFKTANYIDELSVPNSIKNIDIKLNLSNFFLRTIKIPKKKMKYVENEKISRIKANPKLRDIL